MFADRKAAGKALGGKSDQLINAAGYAVYCLADSAGGGFEENPVADSAIAELAGYVVVMFGPVLVIEAGE